jgi:zinc/manganese transport system permease protein
MGLAVGEAWLGLIMSYQTDWPSSFWIAAFSGGIYLAAWALTRRGATA